MGEYDNIFFKTMEMDNNLEEYTLSLYYGIKKNQLWKMTSSVSGNWKDYNYSDNDWTSVTLGSVTTTVSGTQYFRKTFTSIANMAAYEAQFNYRCGLIAYLNGVEILRDNMNDAGTQATGCYASTSYHGIIRPGSEVSSTQSILAIELHFTSTDNNPIDFDTFIALNAPSLINSNCYILNDGITYTTSVSLSNPDYLFDWSYYSFSFVSTPSITIDYSFSKATPFVNGLRIWPYNTINYAPKDFSLGGKNDGTTYNTIFTISGQSYTSSEDTIVNGYFNAGLYKNYRLAITSAVSASNLYLYELHLLVCGQGIPSTIEMEPSSISVLAGYQIITVKPVITEFTSCTVQPSLPEGLTLNMQTCTITGFAHNVTPLTVYTITSTINGQQYSGTIPMEFIGCSGQVTDFYRTYREDAAYEYFEVIDDATQQVVYSEAAGSTQVNLNNIHHFLCLTGNKYIVNLHSTSTWWRPLSWLYVRGMFLFVQPQSSLNQYENIIRAKFDSDLGLPSSYTFYVPYAIPHSQQWYYKMGEVPDNWYSSSTEGWTLKPESGYPASTNQIQLYKKTFTVNSLTGAAVVLNIRYMYGCIVYLNNHEVFRNGVTGSLSTSSLSTNSYTETRYHQVSLPVKTFAMEGSPSVDYIVQGSNTIAIALVAASSSQTSSVFDCALRVMGHNVQSRYLNDFSITGSGVSGTSVGYFAFWYYSNNYYSTTCGDNYINVKFSYDRREWISSLGVQLFYTQHEDYIRKFTLKARNPEDGNNWTVLKEVQGMTWSQAGQLRKIYIANNKPYNEYRFENLGTGDASHCAWKLARIDLMCDAQQTVPNLTYEHSSISIYKDIEMAEEYASGEYYMDFTINPILPTGITIDPNSGTISGTAHTLAGSQTYTITAKKYTGETTSTTITIAVEVCTGGRSLITLVARTDSAPNDASYTLYQGKGTSGTIVSSIDNFAMADSLNYADFCLNHNIYTLQLKSTQTYGWANPAGYYLTIDVGTMKFEMGQVTSVTTAPAIAETMFSSYLPFQIEYDDWKVYKDIASVSSTWNTADFDDSTWTTMKLQDIGTSESTTVYVRRTFTIPNLEDYSVLNIHIKYIGGIVGYFNGRKVARFNLEENFDENSESLAIHDSSKYSNFHVILNTVGATTSKNVIAFEIHRPKSQSSAVPIVFDTTGVFGVNDCSIVVDTYSAITGSQPDGSVTLADFFDLTPVSFGYLPNAVGSYMQWTVENLEGSRFNSYAWQTLYQYSGWGFSLYSRMNEEDEYISALEKTNQQTLNRGRLAWEVPVGIAGFTQYKYQTDTTSPYAISFSAHFFQYCKPQGSNICPGIDDYPPVGEGQISPGPCGYGYTGYSYRQCTSGTLGAVMTDHCTYKAPASLSYSSNRFNFVIGITSTTGEPTFFNLITNFRLLEGTTLPTGLTLNPSTGAIEGVPTEESGLRTYTIYGENPKGAVSTVVNISVRYGECPAEGNFQKTKVGETATYECSLAGSYIGTQKRACTLGAKDGEWQKIQGTCIPTMMIVIIVIVVIVIIVIVVLFVMKAGKKTKAVAGTKGKKPAKTMKSTPKKNATSSSSNASGAAKKPNV